MKTTARKMPSRRDLFKVLGLTAATGALAAYAPATLASVSASSRAAEAQNPPKGRTREYWVQVENHPWDACPWNIDRATGTPLSTAGTGSVRPASEYVLLIRRYTANWAEPADEPVNPWDLVEPDPAATFGTLPGAVLRAKVGDELVVHFRNMDARSGLPVEELTHSLHPHGVRRASAFDGAYPLSPTDPAQGQRGDRVAPGESFTYRWTCPHWASAGAWLYHDASITGWRRELGAFGVLVIRASGEEEPDLPSSPVRQPGDTATQFAAVPEPPMRGEYILAFHELAGLGLCLNGRQLLGNTPCLIAGDGTRMTLRVLNATSGPLTYQLNGHRWQQGERSVDTEMLGPGASVTLSVLSGSADEGGGPGEWLITGQVGGQSVQGSLIVTEGGAVTLLAG